MKTRGFTFIDILVGTGLILIIFLGIFGAYQLSLQIIRQTKIKTTATALANEKIESLRNLSYASLGTNPHAIDEPAGEVPQLVSVTQNNITYEVETKIIYISDCFDGPRSDSCPTAPETDVCPRDYKRAIVKVSWQSFGTGEVLTKTDFSPQNIIQEEAACTGAPAGVLATSAFNALGEAVQSPLIEIINPLTGFVLTTAEPWSGKNDFVITPETYKVKVSKTGYSVSQTYNAGDNYNGKIIAESIKSHPVVYDGRLTAFGLSIDKISLMNIQTRGTAAQGYPLIPNAVFKLWGSKTVGNDVIGDPIYKYEENHTTNGSAVVSVSDLEWDSYYFSVNSSNYYLIGIETPLGTTTTQPIDLLPDTSRDVRLILKAENTLLFQIKDASNTVPVFGAGIRLFDASLEYDETLPTNENGEAFFIPLVATVYNFEIQKEGYQISSGQVSVSGDTNKSINLIPNP